MIRTAAYPGHFKSIAMKDYVKKEPASIEVNLIPYP
jgi:hypothetical protein